MKRIVGIQFSAFVCLFVFCALFARADELGYKTKILVKDGQKIAFLGDSITAYGWSQPGGYVRLIVDALHKEGISIKAIPAGISGNTSKDMLMRLDRDVLSKNPNWMTLSCGVNDVWHGINGVGIEAYRSNVTQIVSKALAKGIKVMILTATPIGEDANANNNKLAQYNNFLRQLAKRDNLPLADLSADFLAKLKGQRTGPSSRILTVDGVHMNSDGNVLMAEGCLRAFGMPQAEIEKTESVWLKQGDTAMFTVRAELTPAFGLTLGQYRQLTEVARKRDSDILHLNNTLWLQALGEVMAEHEKDRIVDNGKVIEEADLRLKMEIDKLTTKKL